MVSPRNSVFWEEPQLYMYWQYMYSQAIMYNMLTTIPQNTN